MSEIQFDPLAVCDICGDIGSYDFMGDQLCGKCIRELDEEYSNEPEEEDDEDDES